MYTQSITISESNLNLFQDTIKKLNKKANKLGLQNIKAELISEDIIEESNCGRKVFHKELTFEVSAPKLKYGNFEFIGSIDHNNKSGIMLNELPGKTIPISYKNTESNCDHCNTKRIRNKAYIFQDITTQAYTQIGSTCLKEYFGINPIQELNATLNYFQDFSESEEDFRCGRQIEYHDVSYILEIALELIERNGYTSSKKASEEYTQSTADQVRSYLYKKEFKLSGNYNQKALDIIAWAKTYFADDTSYATNIQNIINSEIVSSKYIGYLVSIIPQYNTAHSTKRTIVNKYYGNIKDKIELTVTCIGVQAIESYYGITTIIRFDYNGYTLVWFASGNKESDFTKDSQYTIKGAIKDHKEYKNQKQTILTRCKTIGL